MKKKFRKIVVDNITYGWVHYGSNNVRIYKGKKMIKEFENLDDSPITPSVVESLISTITD